jgi:hypothetical protein
MFYKAICQAFLLYGCETWTVTKSMLRVLEGFDHKCARRISGLMARQTATGLYYLPLATAMAEAGLYPIQEYIRRRQSAIAQYIATRPVYARCQEGPPRLSGLASRLLRYWEQNHDNAVADFQARHPDPTAGDGAGAAAVETDDDDAGDMALDNDDENNAEMDDDE